MDIKKRKVPWILAIPPEVKVEYTSEILGNYFTDPEVKLRVSLESERIFHELYGLPVKKVVGLTGGLSYFPASLLGAKIEFPQHHSPSIASRRLKSIDDVDELSIGDPYDTELFKMLMRHYEYLTERTKGTNITISSGLGCQGPFTTAVILRGMDFFTDILFYPEKSKSLLMKCVEANLKSLELSNSLSGKTGNDTVGMGDDYGGMVSPELYEEFVYPYLKMVYESTGCSKRTYHCETLKKPHLHFLDKLKIDSFDPGNDDALTIEDIETGTNVSFWYNLFTVRDLLYGTVEDIKEKFIKIANSSAYGVIAEITVGTPRENIYAFLEIAREYTI